MVIQHNMARSSSFFYHASATTPPANHTDFFNTHACLQQHHDFRPVAPSAGPFSLRLSTSPSGVSQADFFCGKLNGITFPYSSGGIHFATFFLKLLGTKNSMIFAINHPTCKNKTEAKKFSL
jgi:hypothetical protein